MKILSGYLRRTIISSIMLIVTLLGAMEIFIVFLKQIGDIGHGQFTITQAFLYALMQIPNQIYLFFPIACLLGTLIGLGLLAQHSELIVMRAAGVSVTQISRAVVRIAFVLLLIVTLIGEVLVPHLMHFSEKHKQVLLSGAQSLATQEGIWVRADDSFVHIAESVDQQHISGISEYLFDKDHHLLMSRYAKHGVFYNSVWTLHDVYETHFTDDLLKAEHFNMLPWNISLQPRTLSLVKALPDEMTLNALYHFIHTQQQNHVATERYELNYWQRIFQPLASCVMMLLAIPFIFGPLRSANMGARFVTGASVGFCFHILNRFFGPISLFYQFPPLVAAMLPTAIFMVIAYSMMRRV